MRLQILTLLCSLSVLVLATGKLEAKSDIDDLLNYSEILFDEKKFVKYSELFTPNATYDPGPGPIRPFEGRDAIVEFVKKSIPRNLTTFTQLGTKFIKSTPPFDKEGRPDRASAVSYNTLTIFAPGNSTEVLILLIKFVDKEIVRTKEPGFGGWRIQNRQLKLIVSSASTITCAA